MQVEIKAAHITTLAPGATFHLDGTDRQEAWLVTQERSVYDGLETVVCVSLWAGHIAKFSLDEFVIPLNLKMVEV
ncbi:MAG: hypothetical protein ACRC8D_07270 [Aeromonas sp.]